jgi:hypothetical protein
LSFHLRIKSCFAKSKTQKQAKTQLIMFRTALVSLLCLATANAMVSMVCDPVLDGDDGSLKAPLVSIVSADEDSVTYTVSQTFSDDMLCWIGTYLTNVDSVEECPGAMNAGPGKIGEYTAVCVDGQAIVDVLVYDATVEGDSSLVLPGVCPQRPAGNTLEFTYTLPCATECAPEEVTCADANKFYNFEDGDASDWTFGTIGGSSGDFYMLLDESNKETYSDFPLPTDATDVTFKATFAPLPGQTLPDELYMRVGDYYLNLVDLKTNGDTTTEMYFAEMKTVMSGTTVTVSLTPDMIASGSVTLGFRAQSGAVAVDNVELSMPCDDGPIILSKQGGGGGDPHFQRWDHHHESFHGECDLVMLHSDSFHDGAGLDLHVRTTIEDYFSYIETAAIRVGDYVVQFHKDYFSLDGAKYTPADLPLTFGGQFQYTIRTGELTAKQNPRFYQHYVVDLHEDSTILLKFYKKYLTIGVSGAAKDFMDSVGLLGDYHTGDMVSRDGQIMTNFEEYGFEWQVNPEDPKLFADSRSPQLPFEQCRMPTASRPARRKLRGSDDALLKAATEACAHVNGSDFDLCTDDVMTTGDVGLAAMW